jgi:Tol biopolymer transport system component
VQGGDIWVKGLPTGQSQRLTADGHNQGPRWSPSGQWLAFRREEQVWLARVDGSGLIPLEEGRAVNAFAWSPVDDRLAYVSGAGLVQVVAVPAAGTGGAALAPSPIAESGRGQIAWSPDGKWIAYERQTDRTDQALWMASADGQQRVELYVSGIPEKGQALLAGWTADGLYLLFWQGDILSASLLADGVPLYAQAASGGRQLQVVAEVVLFHHDFVAAAPHSATHPEQELVAVVAGGYRATWTGKQVLAIDLQVGATAFSTPAEQAACSPAWSPDGRSLAYVAMPDRGDLVGAEPAHQGLMQRHIWLADIQERLPPRQRTDDPAYRDERPLWSADGESILFARIDSQGEASLWAMPAGEGDPVRVVDELDLPSHPAAGPLGFYGYMYWDMVFNWWPGPALK